MGLSFIDRDSDGRGKNWSDDKSDGTPEQHGLRSRIPQTKTRKCKVKMK